MNANLVKHKYEMQSINLMTNDESDGEVRVDRFPETPRSVYTLAIYTANYVGIVTVEATISLNPSETDWFVIHAEEFAPFGEPVPRARSTLTNLEGRFISMRARAERTLGYPTGIVSRVTVI